MSEPSSERDFDNTIHAMRGLGVTLVVLTHALRLFVQDQGSEPVDLIIRSFIMPLFFFVSGWVSCSTLVKRRSSLSAVIVSRLKRLMSVYLFLSLAVLAGKLVFSALDQNQWADRSAEWDSGLLAILAYPGDCPMITMWFLYALFMVQLLSHAFARVGLMPLERVVPVSLCLGGLLVLNVVASPHLPGLLGLRAIGQYWIYFYLGVLAARQAKVLHRVVHRFRYALVLLSLAWVVLWIAPMPGLGLAFLYAAIGIVVTWAVASIICDKGHHCRFPLNLLSDHAYVIYTMSYFFQVGIRIVFVQILMIDGWALLAFSVVVSLAGPVVLSLAMLEKSPLLRRCVLGDWRKNAPDTVDAAAALQSAR